MTFRFLLESVALEKACEEWSEGKLLLLVPLGRVRLVVTFSKPITPAVANSAPNKTETFLAFFETQSFGSLPLGVARAVTSVSVPSP